MKCLVGLSQKQDSDRKKYDIEGQGTEPNRVEEATGFHGLADFFFEVLNRNGRQIVS